MPKIASYRRSVCVVSDPSWSSRFSSCTNRSAYLKGGDAIQKLHSVLIRTDKNSISSCFTQLAARWPHNLHFRYPKLYQRATDDNRRLVIADCRTSVAFDSEDDWKLRANRQYKKSSVKVCVGERAIRLRTECVDVRAVASLRWGHKVEWSNEVRKVSVGLGEVDFDWKCFGG